MSDFFKMGDVVVCVDAGNNTAYLANNAIYRVRALKGPYLYLVGVHAFSGSGQDGFSAHRFRHLPKADDTFIQQMRSLKPARAKESAR